jgi:hypothetical protein
LRITLGAATLVTAAVLGGATAAFADESPALTVTPSTALVDGQTVTATATGFAANDQLFFSQCGNLNGQLLCASDGISVAPTDENGRAETAVTVRLGFVGADVTGTPIGTVDCSAPDAGCGVAVVSSDFTRNAMAAISFG